MLNGESRWWTKLVALVGSGLAPLASLPHAPSAVTSLDIRAGVSDANVLACAMSGIPEHRAADPSKKESPAPMHTACPTGEHHCA